MLDFYDFFQNKKIQDANANAVDASYKSDKNSTDLRSIQDQVNSLNLACLAMSELLEGVGISRKMIVEKMEEIDRRDGKADGQYSSLNTCKACSRKVASKYSSCIYCGEALEKTSIL